MYLYASLDTLLPPLHRWAAEAQGKLGWGLESGKIPTSKCLKYGCPPDQRVSTLYLQPTEINRVWRVTELDKCRITLGCIPARFFSNTSSFLRENTAKSLERWSTGPAAWGQLPSCSLQVSVHTGELPHADSPPWWPPLFGVTSKSTKRQRLDKMLRPHTAAAPSRALSSC